MSIFLQCVLAFLMFMAISTPVAIFYEKTKKEMEAEDREGEDQ